MPFVRTPRGYEVPDKDEQALVPKHLLSALLAVDADISGQEAKLMGEVASAAFPQVAASLPSNDLNQVYRPGAYVLGAPYPTGFSGQPAESTTASVLTVYASPGGGSWAVQELYQYGTSPRRWWRVSRNNTGGWNDWQPVDVQSVGFAKRLADLPNADLNLVYAPGAYALAAPYPTGYSNMPTENVTASILNVYSAPGGGVWGAQEIIQYGLKPRRWWRVSKNASGGWNDWQEVATGGGGSATGPSTGAPHGASHALRVQAFKDAYPLVKTGGKGAVVFRYDHGLDYIKNLLLPSHRAHRLPLYIAMNSRLWGNDENAGVTADEVKAWIASDRAEIGNHTADHKDRNTAEGMWDTVVNGRRELEAQLGITVHGFTVPGVSEYNTFEGFAGSLDGYSGTYMGALVLSHHGITSGSITPQYRILDGQIRQGSAHITVEKYSFEQVKAIIDRAANTKTAVTLMLHPRYIGMAGYMTAETHGQICSYIRQKIDAGELADITYYQSHHATL